MFGNSVKRCAKSLIYVILGREIPTERKVSSGVLRISLAVNES